MMLIFQNQDKMTQNCQMFTNSGTRTFLLGHFFTSITLKQQHSAMNTSELGSKIQSYFRGLKKYFNGLLHIGFWLGYLLFLIVLLFTISQSNDINSENWSYYFWFIVAIGIIPTVISFYLQWMLPSQPYETKTKKDHILSIFTRLCMYLLYQSYVIVDIYNTYFIISLH